MQVNTKSIKSRFEKSMDKYDENAVVQQEIAQRLISKVSSINQFFDSVLELGVGTGLLTNYAKNSLKFDRYIGNDLIKKSKKYLLEKIPSAEFIHGNALKISGISDIDLILSNAVFQWFSDLQSITVHCRKMLKKGGILAFSTFGRENFKEIAALSGLKLDYLSVYEVKNVVEKSFKILDIEESHKVLEFRSPLELLLHMKNTGVNSLSQTPWNIGKVKDFCQNCIDKYDKITLTYNPIIVIAEKC